jgi:hypothetical protein
MIEGLERTADARGASGALFQAQFAAALSEDVVSLAQRLDRIATERL